MTASRFRLAAAYAAAPLLSLLAACSDRLPSRPDLAPAAPAEARAGLRCEVRVDARELTCIPLALATGAARGDVILGGQGINVRLASSGVAYDTASATLRADVTVQNLLAQAMGTPDGTTVTGVKVFFGSGPAATTGAGTVTVQNPDGYDLFTAAEQPYFAYGQVLQPQQVSASRTWRWNVPATVGTFAFVVYVQAALPAEQGVLHWNVERGRAFTSNSVRDVWGASASDLFLVDGGGAIWRGSTSGWTLADTHSDGTPLNALWGTSATNVFAVGDLGTIRHFDGASWTPMSSGTTQSLKAIWGSGAGDV
jgi:hypothetical protein